MKADVSGLFSQGLETILCCSIHQSSLLLYPFLQLSHLYVKSHSLPYSLPTFHFLPT